MIDPDDGLEREDFGIGGLFVWMLIIAITVGFWSWLFSVF